MLTKEKRQKLITGTVATIMTLGIAGCGNENPAYTEIQKAQNEKENENHSSWFPFFGGYFLGRTMSPSNNIYVTPPPRNNITPNPAAKAAGANGQTSKAASTTSKWSGTTTTTTSKSSVGSAGTSGKTGIGAGAARSSAVS